MIMSDGGVPTTRVPHPSAHPVYRAAGVWRERCLLDDRRLFPAPSLFGEEPGATAEDGVELEGAISGELGLDLDGVDSEGRLRTRLARTSPGARLLAAELLYAHLLVARSSAMGGQRKRALVESALRSADPTLSLPADLAAALDSGLVDPGRGFDAQRWRHLAYLARVFAGTKQLPQARRARVLGDPAEFVAFLDGIDEQGAWAQRYSLEHLLFPDASLREKVDPVGADPAAAGMGAE